MTSSHEGALPQGFPYTRGTVEDSHARVKADLEALLVPATEAWWRTLTREEVLEIAARVEQLGQDADACEADQLACISKLKATIEAREAEIAKVRAEMVGHASGVDPEKCSAFQEHTRRICLEWASRLGGATT